MFAISDIFFFFVRPNLHWLLKRWILLIFILNKSNKLKLIKIRLRVSHLLLLHLCAPPKFCIVILYLNFIVSTLLHGLLLLGLHMAILMHIIQAITT